jgi:hypothetical protein
MSNQVVEALERAGKQIVHALGEGASKAEHRLLHETADNLETAANKHIEHDGKAAKEFETAARRKGDEHVTESTAQPGTRRAPSEPGPGGSEIPTVNVSGKDVPGARTPFARRTDLEPNTAYNVEGRGRFYTDENGRVSRVETQTGDKGKLNPELTDPQPNTTYVVGGHTYRTDSRGRTTSLRVDNLQLNKGIRSPSIQSKIGRKGGTDYDGGHLLGAQFGGAREDINLVPELRSVNRAGPGSVYELETKWRAMLNESPPNHVSYEVTPHYAGNGEVPDRITIRYTVDGVPQKPKVFKNV